MMLTWLNRSISRKLMAVVLTSTLTALLVAAVALLGYEVRNYQASWIADLEAQAEIIGRVSTPALGFNDAQAAQENLAALQTRRSLLAASIYDSQGKLFAGWQAPGAEAVAREVPAAPGSAVQGGTISIVRPVIVDGELLGSVYIRARYLLWERLQDHGLILLAVMAAALVVAALLALRLQSSYIRPILQITDTARGVVERHDFSPRARRQTDDEIGVLVDAFNTMLNEVGQRTAALEEANRVLQKAMEERRQAEQALRLADRRKDEFLATLAHELRNPLAPLTTGLEIMEQLPNNPGVQQQAREVMQRQLQHLVRLVDDLLDVSRITTGKLTIRHERVQLQALIGSAVEAVMPAMRQKHHHLDLQLPHQPIELEGDSTRLMQVIFNLLSNAARYTPAGGEIRLQAGVDDAMLRISVTDNGIGLSAEALESVFDMFVQGDQTLERNNGGLGVGLTLARRLTELHGGSLSVSSPGPGKGSVFTVLLPMMPGDRAKAGVAPRPAARPVPAKVLLVDDNVDYVNSLAPLLRQQGHEVLVLHDAASALARVEEFDPDVCFLDIGLPGMNGFELARRLRALPRFTGVFLVAVTGWGQEKDRALAREAGFDEHLVKPVGMDTIQTMVARMQSGNGNREVARGPVA